MAHMIEIVNGKAQMAYAGEKPWHGLGTQVPADLTPAQMLEAAGLNWTVEKIPAFAEIAGQKVGIGRSALVRSFDDSVLDVVSDDWNPIQNEQAFEFFNDFITAGDMSMETAGSLRDGQIVWGLANVKEEFELFGGDHIGGYLLFTNFHKYGFSTDVRFTSIRTVCNNTLTAALSEKAENVVKISHRKVFNADEVKMVLGVAKDRLVQYKEAAEFLGSKRYNDENIVDYFKRVFPVSGSHDNKKKDISRNAKVALEAINVQPGTEYAPGTWWQAFNAVTYMTDHILGRNTDNRLTSAWYGSNRNLKSKALTTAIEFAEAA